jgi:hypothetical protein
MAKLKVVTNNKSDLAAEIVDRAIAEMRAAGVHDQVVADVLRQAQEAERCQADVELNDDVFDDEGDSVREVYLQINELFRQFGDFEQRLSDRLLELEERLALLLKGGRGAA